MTPSIVKIGPSNLDEYYSIQFIFIGKFILYGHVSNEGLSKLSFRDSLLINEQFDTDFFALTEDELNDLAGMCFSFIAEDYESCEVFATCRNDGEKFSEIVEKIVPIKYRFSLESKNEEE